jgi:hypothetical protein
MMHKFWGVIEPMMSLPRAARFISQVGSGPWSLEARRKQIADLEVLIIFRMV